MHYSVDGAAKKEALLTNGTQKCQKDFLRLLVKWIKLLNKDGILLTEGDMTLPKLHLNMFSKLLLFEPTTLLCL